MNDAISAIAAVLCLVVLLVICMAGCQMESMRARAVKNGAATWVLDPETGNTTFTWNDELQPTPTENPK